MFARHFIHRFDTLEPRLLLASSASVNAAGLLTVLGDANNNVIDVASTLDTVKVTCDDASFSFDAAAVKGISVEGFEGNDKVTIDVPLPSTLIGDAGNDTLVGNAADDDLQGGTGNDRLTGARGTNSIDPGTGNDVIDYSEQGPGGVGMLSDHVLYRFLSTRDGTYVFRDSIPDAAPGSSIKILLTSGDDSMFFQDIHTNWDIDAGAGNDFLTLYSGASVRSINGGAGNDSINFRDDDGVTTAWGGSGNDTILQFDKAPGLVKYDGGPGSDKFTLWSFWSPTTLNLNVPPGVGRFDVWSYYNLAVHGNSLDNNITARASNVSLYGSGGNDRLEIYDANNITPGLPHIYDQGHDLMNGGSGNDTLIGLGADVFQGGSGNDTADFSGRGGPLKISLDNKPNDGQSNETLNVEADIETVIGGGGNDLIIGNPFNNRLVGNGGDDTLWGGAGNDTLVGGPGHDKLYGQDGNDTIYAKDGQHDTVDGGNGFDAAQRDNTSTIKDSVLNIESYI